MKWRVKEKRGWSAAATIEDCQVVALITNQGLTPDLPGIMNPIGARENRENDWQRASKGDH